MVLIIKRIVSFFAALLFIGNVCAFGDFVSLSACSAVLMWNGRVIYEKNARQRLPMASTTKLMTALVVADNCQMDETVLINASDCAIEGSSMYLRPDEKLSVQELLKGLLLVSGNDAALALARHAGGSVENFVKLMNEKAEELSMTSTHFENPHGLNDEGHYSTAEDLARLMRSCLDNEAVRKILSLKSCVVDGKTLVNHNKLLYTCAGCTGGKTGYTEAAGRCLVSSCKREGTELICVTLNAPDDWNDHMALYNKTFHEYSVRNVTEGMRFSVPIVGSTEKYAYLVPQQEKTVFAADDSEVTVTARLPWFLFAPAEKGESIGKAIIRVDGVYAGEYPLVCRDSVMAENS